MSDIFQMAEGEKPAEQKEEEVLEKPKILDQAPEKYRDRKDLYKFNSLEGFINEIDNLRKERDEAKNGATEAIKKIPRYKDEMTAEERKAYDEFFEVPEKYDLGEGFESFEKAFKDAGLPKTQAKKLQNFYIETQKQEDEARKARINQELGETVNGFKLKYQGEWEKKLKSAGQVAKTLFPEDDFKILNAAGVFNRMTMLDRLLEIGEKYLGEDKIFDGSSDTYSSSNAWDFKNTKRK